MKSSLMNVLGVALIVFGIVAVVYMVMNYSQGEDIQLVPQHTVEVEAP